MSSPTGTDFSAFLSDALEQIGVDVDVLADYLIGILEDDTSSNEEKLESVSITIQDSIGDNISSVQVAETIVAAWHDSKKVAVTPVVPDVLKAAFSLEASNAEIRRSKGADRVRNETKNSADITEDEAKELEVKKRILRLYAVEQTATVEFDEEGTLVKNAPTSRAQVAEDEDLFRNDNRQQVTKQQQELRLRSKLEHEKEVKKRLEQKLMEETKKSKEKQRVAKKERRTGM